MGAYDNPTILRDTSLTQIGKGVDAFAKSITIAMASANKAREARTAAAKKEKSRVQGIQFKIQTDQWKIANKNIADYKETKGEFFGEYQDNVTWLLNGKGVKGQEGYELGAIDASTILATKTDLQPAEKAYLNAIITRATRYQTNALTGAGSVIADLEDFEGVNAVDMNNTHYWAGDTGLEQDTSMLTTYALKNYKVKGLTYTKKSIVGKNGEGLVEVTSKIDPKSDLFNRLSEDTKDKLEKNNYTLSWKKDPSEWKEGLIREISKTIDVDKMTKESKITNGEEGLNETYYLGDSGTGKQINVRTFIGEGKENNQQYKFIDTKKILNNVVIDGDIKKVAARMVGGGEGLEGDFQAAMQNTLRMGNKDWNIQAVNEEGEAVIVNNFSQFRALGKPVQEKILEKELQEQYLEDALPEDTNRLEYQDLSKDLKNYIIKSRGGVEPDKEEMFYYEVSPDKITNITKDSDFTYQKETLRMIDDLEELDYITETGIKGRELPPLNVGSTAPTKYDKYDNNQAEIHKKFLEDNFNLNIKLGKDAYNANKEAIEQQFKRQEINNKTGVVWTKEEKNEAIAKLDDQGLFVLVGKTYKRQPAYNSYDKNSLTKIIGDHAKGYKTDVANRNFQNEALKRKALANTKTN